MKERTIVLAGPLEDCRWAAITESAERCEGTADWVVSGPHPTMKLCSTHTVAKLGARLDGATLSAGQAPTRKFVTALRRLADAIEAADTRGS
jgi:hypothetical protein